MEIKWIPGYFATNSEKDEQTNNKSFHCKHLFLVELIMSHSDMIVESTSRDHVFPTVRTRILEQSRIVDALYMVPGCHPALESFQTNPAGKLGLSRQAWLILGDKLKQLFWIFEILNTAWNLRRNLDILTTLVNHNITKSLQSKEPSQKLQIIY